MSEIKKSKMLKSSLSIFLAITIIFSSAYVGLSEVDFSGLFAVEAKATNSMVESAVDWAINIANDNNYGYSQVNRYGNPDYDCSSLVTTAFRNAGFNIEYDSTTFNMRSRFVAAGFTWIPASDIPGFPASYTNLQRGDVLLSEPNEHTELYIGNGKNVGAHANYNGIPGGIGGGSTWSNAYNAYRYGADEIDVCNYWNDNWNGVLRYEGIDYTKPSDAWVSLPNGNESSYKVNTDVPITIGANNARYYTIVMYRDGEHYYEETFYNESGSHTIPASFDKTGHYSCYIIARYTYDGEFVTSSWQGWDIVDNVPQNLTVSVNKPLGRYFYPGETVNITANATYGYKKYVCIHKADGSFYAGSYVDGTNYSCVVNEPGEYYVNFEAFNACGSNLSNDVYFTVSDVDAYILMPDSNGYSYLLNEEVPMTMVAPGATHFTIVMYKDGEFYYENMFYNEAGSHTIPASFDKTGHYTGYMVAKNNSGMEVFSELYSWDIVDDVPQNLSISTNKNFFYPGETIEFTLKAENGNKKYIGIHKADGTFFNGGYLLGEEYEFRITAFGDYYADFEAMNAYGSKISEKVYFSVKDIYPLDEETSVDFYKNFIYTDKYSLQSINTILGCFSNTKVSVVNEDLLYYGTGTLVSVTTADSQVTYTLVVNGDTNGDSVCDVIDCAQVALVSNGHKTFDGAYELAADSNSDDVIDINDYQSIVNKALAQ